MEVEGEDWEEKRSSFERSFSDDIRNDSLCDNVMIGMEEIVSLQAISN